jgi:protein-S-isoprenylcysteine O-methyltransferase Ste14
MPVTNLINVVVVAAVACVAYPHRNQNEERMLVSTLPGYVEYRSKTPRLNPPVY